MGTIIVGVDGSPTARAAAGKAADLAAGLGHRLVITCGYGKLEDEYFEGANITLSTQESAEAIGEQTIRYIRTEHPDLDIIAVSKGGKPADALLSVADRFSADLIVVGNKRVQGAARILGSVAADVARKTSCDLYVAHTHAR